MVQAWPDLWGCTGAMLDGADVGAGTGATLGTAGVCGLELQVSWCNGWRLQQLCRLGGHRQWHRNVRSGRGLWCGCSDI